MFSKKKFLLISKINLLVIILLILIKIMPVTLSKYQRLYVYDDNGNEIRYHNSKGEKEWREYDSDGNVIHVKNNKGYDVRYEYDTNAKYIPPTFNEKTSKKFKCNYLFEGRQNDTLIFNFSKDGSIQLESSYGEIIYIANSLGALAETLIDLEDGCFE